MRKEAVERAIHVVGDAAYSLAMNGDEAEILITWIRFRAGHWTREPAVVEGVYLMRYPDGYFDLGTVRHDGRELWTEYAREWAEKAPWRWSVPLPAMPPVPGEPGES